MIDINTKHALKNCEEVLESSPYNQTAWILKCRSLAALSRVDDLEFDADDFEGALDYVAQAALPSGRVVTGYARPVTTMREVGGSQRSALRSSNERMTLSSAGRMNLVTPSLVNEPGGPFINLERLDLKKYAAKPLLSMALFEYIYDHCRDFKRALELASHAIAAVGRLYLAKVYLKLDQPNISLQMYSDAATKFPVNTKPFVYMARIYEEMFDLPMSIKMYKRVLNIDSSHVEALASLAANYFYDDQPEVALRYYRRLLQMGKDSNPEIWNNMGLCSFYSQQYDLAVPCFERALSLASDDDMLSDIWYNVGHVACSTGDLEFAYRSFKLCVTSNNKHAEGWNNLGVLEIQMAKSISTAQEHFTRSTQICDFIYEPQYNLSLASLQKGDIQASLEHVETALSNYPHHYSSKALRERLRQMLL
ncbi:hypothetical protein BC829DRAFT_415666 [Chytridium lagenaria]|nr:hypothetical protein BC829DRAFT_415666 [Chytridium lagenaria]